MVFGAAPASLATQTCTLWFPAQFRRLRAVGLLETSAARGEVLGSRDFAHPTRMFEEPEWAEEAPVATGLEPVAARPRPAAASQIKVSDPAGAPGAVSGGEAYPGGSERWDTTLCVGGGGGECAWAN